MLIEYLDRPPAGWFAARRDSKGSAQVGLGRADGGRPSRRSQNLHLQFPRVVLCPPQGLSPWRQQ
jgi:hypothetical protein